MIQDTQLMIRKPTLCQVLDMSPTGIENLMAKDPTFPKPIKSGESRQSRCYFIAHEVRAWIEAKAAARDAA